MSKDGVVPPLGGPSRRPAGGPANHSGAEVPAGGPGAQYGSQREQGDGRSGGHAADGVERTAPEAASAVVSEAAAALAASIGSGSAAARRKVVDPRTFDDADPVEDLDGTEAGGEPLSAAEINLAEALRGTVARVGVSGPPPDGLVRIRRKARTRQRNRAALAGSAGVLVLAIGVTLATGDRFDIVPTLTSAVGLGGSGSNDQPAAGDGAQPSAAANGDHAVWPTGSAGKEGVAIGPVGPVMATPSAAAATKVPLCTTSSLSISTTVSATENGVVYGRVDAVAQQPCVVVGPPVLTVANQAGTAASSVKILREDRTAAPQLPPVTSWGTTMVLKAGDAFQFQFAWSAAACPASVASPSASPTTVAAAREYYLGYAATGTTPTSVITLTANCGANVYVTDIYAAGTFPLPKTPTTPPPPVTIASSTPAPAPPPASSEAPQPPPSSPSTADSPSPPPDTTSPSPTGATDTSGSGSGNLSTSNATSPAS